MKSLKQIKNLKNKRVLVRCDFDLPLKKGRVQDDSRLIKILPTIEYLLKKKANKIILIGHAGRPGGKVDRNLTLKPVKAKLEKLLKKDIKFITIDRYISKKIQLKVQDSTSQITMLENLRFSDREKANCKRFAKNLAKLGDIYINEAWANSHRAHASVDAVQEYIPSYAGLHLEQELKYLSAVKKKPRHPLLLVVGGAKIETKLPVIKEFLNKADAVLVGGAVANNFLKAKGFEVGSSLVNDDYFNEAKKILTLKINNSKILLPLDWQVKDNKILDIGPRTIKLFERKIKSAQSIIWNGPMGKFEDKKFQAGTNAIARAILKSKAKIIIGGGDTDKIFSGKKIPKNIFISSGGGAMLEYLAGKSLPGLKRIHKRGPH